jgi:hypothetical protein
MKAQPSTDATWTRQSTDVRQFIRRRVSDDRAAAEGEKGLLRFWRLAPLAALPQVGDLLGGAIGPVVHGDSRIPLGIDRQRGIAPRIVAGEREQGFDVVRRPRGGEAGLEGAVGPLGDGDHQAVERVVPHGRAEHFVGRFRLADRAFFAAGNEREVRVGVVLVIGDTLPHRQGLRAGSRASITLIYARTAFASISLHRLNLQIQEVPFVPATFSSLLFPTFYFPIVKMPFATSVLTTG